MIRFIDEESGFCNAQIPPWFFTQIDLFSRYFRAETKYEFDRTGAGV